MFEEVEEVTMDTEGPESPDENTASGEHATETETDKKTGNGKKDHFDPEPNHDPIIVYDSRMQPQSLNFRNDKPSKSNAFQHWRFKRQGSRQKGEKGFQRKMYSFKKVTNDDVMVVFKSAE